MTGRDLIIYILRNNLEDEILFQDGVFVGLMTEEEAALKFNVGIETIRAWYWTKAIDGIVINDSLYFWRNTTDPRKVRGNYE